MDDFTARWSFVRTSALPILDCLAEANNWMVETFLLTAAVDYIEQAKKFNGIAVQGNAPKTKSNIAVYFSLQFPSERELYEFVKTIKKNNLI